MRDFCIRCGAALPPITGEGTCHHCAPGITIAPPLEDDLRIAAAFVKAKRAIARWRSNTRFKFWQKPGFDWADFENILAELIAMGDEDYLRFNSPAADRLEYEC